MAYPSDILDGLPLLLTVDDVAELLHKSTVHVRRMCAAGSLPACKLGKTWHIPRRELEKLLAESMTGRDDA